MSIEYPEKAWYGSFRLKWKANRKKWRDFPIAILFLLPSILVFSTFVFFPLIYTFYLSFTKWNFIDPEKIFIGLSNFQKLFNTPLFHQVIRNTAVYSIAVVVFSLSLGLLLALVLNQKFRGRSLYRALIFFPYIITPSAMALVWIWIFDPQYGIMNALLKMFLIPGAPWLSSKDWALPAIIIMTVWRFMGYNMVIFLGGLQNINPELREAARIDGANPWMEFWKITLPLLSPTTFFILITMIISMFQVFDVVYVMTFGGPVNATNVIVFYLYQHAFQFFEAGYASAIAVVLFIIIMILTAFQFITSKRWVFYD